MDICLVIIAAAEPRVHNKKEIKRMNLTGAAIRIVSDLYIFA